VNNASENNHATTLKESGTARLFLLLFGLCIESTKVANTEGDEASQKGAREGILPKLVVVMILIGQNESPSLANFQVKLCTVDLDYIDGVVDNLGILRIHKQASVLTTKIKWQIEAAVAVLSRVVHTVHAIEPIVDAINAVNR
jgi:hypothetical protein